MEMGTSRDLIPKVLGKSLGCPHPPATVWGQDTRFLRLSCSCSFTYFHLQTCHPGPLLISTPVSTPTALGQGAAARGQSRNAPQPLRVTLPISAAITWGCLYSNISAAQGPGLAPLICSALKTMAERGRVTLYSKSNNRHLSTEPQSMP